MKKLSTVMMMALIGGMAFASSLSIPWFVDNAPDSQGANWPPTQGTRTYIYLHNNTTNDIVCSIAYYNAEGVFVGPNDDPNTPYDDTTFVIPALSTVAFAPVAALGATGGESSVGDAIPNRPLPDGKMNGAATITWAGGPNDIQGMLATANSQLSYAHLLPPGN